jgi:hypothetical protein
VSLSQQTISAVDLAIVALGDLLVNGQRAITESATFVPGAELTHVPTFSTGKMAIVEATSDDFPGTNIEVFDKSLLDVKPSAIPKDGDFYKVLGSTYRVIRKKVTYAGATPLLVQCLVRPNPARGVIWP